MTPALLKELAKELSARDGIVSTSLPTFYQSDTTGRAIKKEWDKRKHLSSNIPDRRERRKAVCKKNGITTKNYQQVIFPVLYIPFSPTLWIEIGQIAPAVSLLFEATSGWKDFLVTDHVWGAPLWRVWQLSRQFPSTRATWRRHDTSHLQGTH